MSSAKKKLIDPLASATIVGSKSKSREALDRVNVVDEATVKAVTEYARLDRERKTAEADAKQHKDTLLTEARRTFAERMAVGNFESFVLASGETTIQVTVPRKITSFNQSDLTILNEEFEGILDVVEEAPKVTLNLDVWQAHDDVLMEALNAKDANGKPIVPPDVLKALFSREVKAKDDLFPRIAAFAKNDSQRIQTLLFAKLGVSPTLSVK